MALLELGSPAAVQDFLQQRQSNSNAAAVIVVVTFSAHWCGPCKASKPALEQLAAKYAGSAAAVKFGIAYEDALGDAIHMYRIRAFPTHVLFGGSGSAAVEVQRVEGANVAAVEDMVQEALKKVPQPLPLTGGETLGGGTAPLSPAAARAARAARFSPAVTAVTAEQAAAAAAAPAAADQTHPMMDEEELDTKKPSAADAAATDHDGDTEMKDARAVHADADGDDAAQEEAPNEDPTAKLNPEFLQTLTETMGFSLIRAQKGLLYGSNGGGTVEGAIEWLMEHQDDGDIDEENIPLVKATSYKCNECGKILSNMANLELHANKTGHSDFEESLERVQPMTDEQKAAKIAEIKVRSKPNYWTVCDRFFHEKF